MSLRASFSIILFKIFPQNMHASTCSEHAKKFTFSKKKHIKRPPFSQYTHKRVYTLPEHKSTFTEKAHQPPPQSRSGYKPVNCQLVVTKYISNLRTKYFVKMYRSLSLPRRTFYEQSSVQIPSTCLQIQRR